MPILTYRKDDHNDPGAPLGARPKRNSFTGGRGKKPTGFKQTGFSSQPGQALRPSSGQTHNQTSGAHKFSKKGKSFSNSRRPNVEFKHHDNAERNRQSGGDNKKHHGSKKADNIPPVGDSIRIIPLGGVEQVGKNMTAFEIGNDIIVVDAGLQFGNEDTPGIDYIIPNTKYLEERKEKIRALIITHGHLDHIGGIPYIMDKIGNPPIYAPELAAIMIKKKQDEFPHLKPLNIKFVEKDEKVPLGKTSVRFFGVSHSIPDSMAVIIETPYGNLIGSGDLRIDNVSGQPTEEEEAAYDRLGREKNLLLMAESTNAENPGFSISEDVVIKNIEQIIREVTGRLIIGTFASNLKRIMEILALLEKYNRKVVIEGRSMKQNLEIVEAMGMLKVDMKKLVIPVEDVANYPDNKIVIIATGQQGEDFAAITRMSTKSHKHIKIKKGDTILLSSSVIPGNEMSVQRIKDNLSRQGASIIHYRISEVHASGHASSEELLWIHKKLKPKFFIPIHGYHYMLHVHAELAKKAGVSESNIVIPDNGMIIEIQNKGEKITILKEKAPASLVMVDGFSVGDEQDVVIRDRMMLAQDGMFVVIATIDCQTGKLKKSPDLISRGFVYLKENQDLLHQSRLIVKKTIETGTVGQNPIDFEYLKSALTDNIAKFLFQKTAKRPLVIPVLLSI